MNEVKDLVQRILRFIDECQKEAKSFNDNDEFMSMLAYKSAALDLIQIGESVGKLKRSPQNY